MSILPRDRELGLGSQPYKAHFVWYNAAKGLILRVINRNNLRIRIIFILIIKLIYYFSANLKSNNNNVD